MLLFFTNPNPPAALRPSDEALASQAQRQPQILSSVIGTLYERHADRVYAYCLARTGNQEDAQDLTSEIFLAALEHLERYDARRSFAGWLYGIAHHKVVDHFRRGSRQTPLEQAEGLADPLGAVEDSAERSIAMQAVARALGTLSSEQADAVTLRLFAGLSTAEASQVMGRSEAAVKMLVQRGLRNLQVRLAATLEVTV